ncbi:MAG: hypothetical protein FWH18_12590, partial [Marinilabiliaceae bacterium]|nr:hypothetical protein [Marinilabiliaceae bacterium]
LKMTPEERAAYEADKKALAEQKTQLQTAELKGEKRGLEKGEAIGLEKEKEEAVIRGYKKGHSIETIADLTDLSKEQILKILKENKLMI